MVSLIPGCHSRKGNCSPYTEHGNPSAETWVPLQSICLSGMCMALSKTFHFFLLWHFYCGRKKTIWKWISAESFDFWENLHKENGFISNECDFWRGGFCTEEFNFCSLQSMILRKHQCRKKRTDPHVAKRCLVRSLFPYFSVHHWLPRYSHLTRVSIRYSVGFASIPRYKQEKQVQLDVVLICPICTRVTSQVQSCTLAH